MQTDFFPIEAFRMEGLLSRVQRTSPGSDNIPNWLFQKCSFEIADVCAYLFNVSFKTGIVPKQWRTAIVTPIPKIPRPKSLSDYRPISITPILSRIAEKFIVNNWRDRLYRRVRWPISSLLDLLAAQLVPLYILCIMSAYYLKLIRTSESYVSILVKHFIL